MICRAIPYEGSEPYIFVSYCHKDKDLLSPMMEQMVLDSYRMWYDDGNHAGDDWLDNIENHLEACQAVVAFISDSSSLSHNCKSEITYALACKKKVIPVLIDSADLPKGLRMQLSSLHYLKRGDFSTDRALLNKIYETEACAQCRAPAGSLRLRDASMSQVKESSNEEKKGGFWDNLVRAATEPDDSAEEASSNISVKKTRKVKIRVGMGKRAVSGPEAGSVLSGASAGEEKVDSNAANADSSCPSDPDDDDKTIYETDYGASGADASPDLEDDDKTVRVNNHCLALLLHPAGQQAYVIRKPQVKIGRSPFRCDVVIEGNESISKQHAEINLANGRCVLRDCNSSNGTFLKGRPLEAGQAAELENPAIFQLNNELFILLSGNLAQKYTSGQVISLLLNEANTALRLIEGESLPLNRNSVWPDGTLRDKKIHREAHARLRKEADGIHLVDEGPKDGNGTFLNGSRMKHGSSLLLASGDQIRLGDTTLTFVSITI